MISVGYFSTVVLLACLISVIHRTYLSYLFEQEYYFSHLSEREREISFKSEAGFYYSFYKTLVENNFIEGIGKLINDNKTEHPNSINTLQRFNLYPEIISALCYKSLMLVMSAFNLPTKICYKINRGPGREPAISCEGIGEPVFVYLEAVFTLNGLMLGLLFLNGVYLSGTIFGGIITVLCFLYNHGECTRVYLTPPLRESFGYPLWVLHSFLVSHSLCKESNSRLISVSISLCTFVFLLSWQLSQFVLAVQTSIVFMLNIVSDLQSERLKLILKGYLVGFMMAVIFQFGNPVLLCSHFLSACLVSLILVKFKEAFCPVQTSPKTFIYIPIFFGLLVAFKAFLSFTLKVEDDSHIKEIMWSKFSSFKSFHSMLYTCAPEFDFIEIRTFIEMFKTCLLPLTFFVVLKCFYNFYIDFRMRQSKDSNSLPLYLIMHLSVFSVMAVTTMRLKLFLVPHLCLMSSLITSSKSPLTYLNKFSIFVAIVSLMSYKGIQNLRLQSSITGEFNDYPTEYLMDWISKKTSHDSVFAGSMSTMATIKLTTGRPIANHPHYENHALRERTKTVYTMFSRKSPEEVWQNAMKLKLDFIVLEKSWCFGRSRLSCSLADIWDVEDSKNKGKPRVCDVLILNAPPFFESVYKNGHYAVLKVVKVVP